MIFTCYLLYFCHYLHRKIYLKKKTLTGAILCHEQDTRPSTELNLNHPRVSHPMANPPICSTI